MPLSQAQLDAILLKDPQPHDRYVAFVLAPNGGSGAVIAIEHRDVFQHYQSVSYSGIDWVGSSAHRSFGLAEVMENLYEPRPGQSIQRCLALIAADPYFDVVPCPPGNHEP